MLGLDIATTTGAALLDGERYLWARAFHWEGETPGAIFRHFRKTLYKIIEDNQVVHVGVEEPLRTDIELRTGKVDETGAEIKTRPPMKTFQRIYGLNAVAEEVCDALGAKHQYIHQATWRKSFLGSVRATKEQSLKEMAVAQARRIDRAIESEDAAEALGVAWCLRGLVDPTYAAPRGDLFEPTLTSARGGTPF